MKAALLMRVGPACMSSCMAVWMTVVSTGTDLVGLLVEQNEEEGAVVLGRLEVVVARGFAGDHARDDIGRDVAAEVGEDLRVDRV